MIYRDKRELVELLVQPTDVVLDVGFWGQGTGQSDPDWVHALLQKRASDVYGIDLDYQEEQVSPQDHYQKTSAESAQFPVSFDVIFAGDLIEHLSNPGLFLDACARQLKKDGRLILTTPNCFNLFNLAGKLTQFDPTVNSDHVCYFTAKTLRKLLDKNGWETSSVDFLYTLHPKYQESWKKKFLNLLYALSARFTPKYMETLVIVARPKSKDVE